MLIPRSLQIITYIYLISGLRSYIIIFERLSLAYIGLYKKTLRYIRLKILRRIVCVPILLSVKDQTRTPQKLSLAILATGVDAREMY